ncbi:DUF2164 domain-containing protein [Fictibacillus barbaricus]|uniref:DUF2164 domain-containing protein n=2 Tax=Fictibacillus barbaricus TaxID=182136 RepID=A0ABS2ZDJ0_9BACL|nr:DUF2164 domain-containing protein [Fictibacillus barbaricus]MBN3544691.1 DUF2164 domain-containing protein [Fictibacillus barbaricus]GGB64733.1 hypothetical protein GCM10007199_33650 [Fictibacillus barbaricus]
MRKMSKEIKEEMIDRIQAFFIKERGEEIGNLAAEQVLDFITEEMASYFYNEGIEDSISALQLRMENLEEDLYTLKHPLYK